MVKTLLLADDESDLREILRLGFEDAGWVVLEAENGKKAFDIFNSQHVDAIITDIRMPGGSGIQLLEKVKSLNKNVPVLVLTGFTDVLEQEALDKGALHIIKKPFDLEMVYALVEEAVHKRI